MKTKVFTILSAVLMVFGLATVYAYTNGGGNSASAPGQANAIANCLAAIANQNANGQTGDANGNPNDAKTAATAVTNCDHFWD